MKKRKEGKKKALFSLIIGILLLLVGIFISALGYVPLNEITMLSPFRSYITSSFALTKGAHATLAPGLVIAFLGILSLLFRRRRPSSFILIPYLAFVYISVVAVVHHETGNKNPIWLMSNLEGRSNSLLVICLVLEVVLLMLLIVLTSSFDDYWRRKHSAENVRIPIQEKKEEAEVKEEGISMKEVKRAAKEHKKHLKEEKKRLKAEEKKNAKEGEEVHVKVDATASASVKMDPNSPIEFPTIEKLSHQVFTSGSEGIKIEEEDVKTPMLNAGTTVSAFEAVSREMNREGSESKEEDEERPKIDLTHPQTFRKGGLLESSLESVSRNNERAKSVNTSPIIGYDDVKKEEKAKKNDSDFAPSNLSPSHPRYKLFESLRRKKKNPEVEEKREEVTHFPSRPYDNAAASEEEQPITDISLKQKESTPPETLSEAIKQNEEATPALNMTSNVGSIDSELEERLQAKQAQIRELEEKQRELEEMTKRLEERLHESENKISSPIETPKKFVDTVVKSDDQELERSSSYYQEKSTAKAVNGAVIDDVEKVEVEPDGAALIEFKAGIGGLASNNAGEEAIINRQKRGYTPPPESILREYPQTSYEIDERTRSIGESIVNLLHDFKIEVSLKDIVKGPTVTLFEFGLAPGVLVSKVLSLKDNIAMCIGGKTIRILAPVPGKNSIGVEIPNPVRATVGFRELIKPLKDSGFKVPMILGRDIMANPMMLDVSKTPHLLIAGTTGSGKSVCINGLVASILYTKSPKEVRILMVDPKIVELQVYNGIPHLLTPVITEPKRVLKMLDWLVEEMERRYHMFGQIGVRNIEGFNGRVHELGYATEKMPYIVLIMDEFADLMTVIGKDIESYVSRLMAKSRAAGIHVVMATQRPSSEVVTGTIKSNIPSRISFAVSSGTNSRIILDQIGAEDLLGRGDMLYMNPSSSQLTRIQGAFLSDDEVEAIANFVKKQGEPDYLDEAIFEDEVESEESYSGEVGANNEEDLYEQAKQIVFERKGASASYLQRRLSIGYNRAAKLVEQMEEDGIVGPANGSKPREILKYE